MGRFAALTACALVLVAAVGYASALEVAYNTDDGLFENFGDGWEERWVGSEQSKYDGKFEVTTPSEWQDPGLQVPEKSKHYGISSSLAKPWDPSQGLVLQYEVKFAQGHTCGGAYIKLLTEDAAFTPETFSNDSPYSIMFGPDKCGTAGKVHFILRHKNPVTGVIEEKHLAAPPAPASDTATHVYTLILDSDNGFEILVDGKERASGSLFEKLEPPINPPKEIPDPSDIKPSDWVDEAKISDPSATRPDDWDDRVEVPDESAVKPAGWADDEPELVDDPDAQKPEDWDEEEDGDWSPPQVPNPKCKAAGCGEWKQPTKRNPAYKGKWVAPLIDNPDYKGPWVQRTIPNPDFYEDKAPLASIGRIGALGLEIWTIDSGYVFDNILVTDDAEVAEKARKELWEPKSKAEKAAGEKKAAESASGKAGANPLAAQLRRFIRDTLLQPYLQPFLDYMDEHAWAGTLVIGFPVTLLVALGVLCMPKKRGAPKRPTVGEAKKQDLTGEDDAEEEEEAAGEEDAAAADKEQASVAKAKLRAAVADAAASAKAAGTSSDVVEEEIVADDEAEDEGTQPRSRTTRRRA